MEVRMLTRAEAATVPGMMDPPPGTMWVMGAVDEQGVAAACGIFLVVHGDPIWVRPDQRKRGKLLLRLWEATRAEILRRGGNGVEVLMTETNPGPPFEETVERLCLAVGGHEIKGRHFVVPILERG